MKIPRFIQIGRVIIALFGKGKFGIQLVGKVLADGRMDIIHLSESILIIQTLSAGNFIEDHSPWQTALRLIIIEFYAHIGKIAELEEQIFFSSECLDV